jgi:hypothetical protein
VSTRDLVMSAISVVFVAGLLIRLPALWRGSAPGLGDEPPSFWPFSRGAWLGLGRIYPVGVAFAVALIAAAILTAANPSFGDPVVVLALAALYALMGVLLVLMGRIILYNEPKIFVAPHQRHQLGLLEDRRASRDRPSSGV